MRHTRRSRLDFARPLASIPPRLSIVLSDCQAPTFARHDRRHGRHHGHRRPRVAPVEETRHLHGPERIRILRRLARAYATITRPAVFRKLNRTVKLPASVVEDAFLKENPSPHRATASPSTCRQGYIPRGANLSVDAPQTNVPCGSDVIHRLQNARRSLHTTTLTEPFLYFCL